MEHIKEVKKSHKEFFTMMSHTHAIDVHISVTAIIQGNKLLTINVSNMKDIGNDVMFESEGKYDIMVNLRCVPMAMLKQAKS